MLTRAEQQVPQRACGSVRTVSRAERQAAQQCAPQRFPVNSLCSTESDSAPVGPTQRVSTAAVSLTGGYSISRPGSGAHSSQTPTQIPQQTASLNRKSGPQGTADSGRTQRQGAHDSLDALHRSRRDKAAHAGPVGSSAGHANVHIDPNVISGALKGGHLTKQGLQGSQQKQQEKQIQNAAHQAAQQLQQQQQKQKEEEKAFVLPKPVRVVFPPAANQTGKVSILCMPTPHEIPACACHMHETPVATYTCQKFRTVAARVCVGG